MSAYLLFKLIHVSCVILSISGFILRAYWKMIGSPLAKVRAVKILPHIIDTFLFLSALGLLFVLGFGLLTQNWLIHKIGLVLVYIVLGMIALGDKYSRPKRITAFIVALLVFIYMLGIALYKTPLGWLILLL